MILWIAIFCFSLFVLVKSSDYFTESAERVGKAVGLPPFLIGVTIVALGTSLPELASSILAVLKASPEIVAGNVVGSNVANVLFILGATALLSGKILISHQIINVDLPFLLGSAFMLALMTLDGEVDRFEGLLCITLLVIYLAYVSSQKSVDVSVDSADLKTYLALPVSAILIYVSADYTVEAVIILAEVFKVGSEIIASTAVALGTSLPELSVSITAARKGRSEIAVGNILGSNVFNVFGVVGLSAAISSIPFTPIVLNFAVPFMLAATILFLLITVDREVTLWEGAMLLIFYLYFVAKLLGAVPYSWENA